MGSGDCDIELFLIDKHKGMRYCFANKTSQDCIRI